MTSEVLSSPAHEDGVGLGPEVRVGFVLGVDARADDGRLHNSSGKSRKKLYRISRHSRSTR